MKLKKALSSREFILFILIIAIILFTGFNSEYFFTGENFRGLMLVICVNAIVASAVTILFISGGFDLSTGSVMATLGIILGILLANGVNIILSIIITILFGIAIGVLTGLIITKAKVNPFIATLGAMFTFRGVAFVVGKASKLSSGTTAPTFTHFPKAFDNIAGKSFLGIEYIVFYMIAILILFYFLSTKNIFFRQNYYIGNNEKAARLLGIKVDRIKIFNYALVSTMVAIATILKASRIDAVSVLTGETLGLEVITAVIIGGASLAGGSGSILGSFFGVVIIALIYNVLIHLNVSPNYNKFFIGLVLLISVIIEVIINKFKEKVVLR